MGVLIGGLRPAPLCLMGSGEWIETTKELKMTEQIKFLGCGHVDENGEQDCDNATENADDDGWYCEDHPNSIVLTMWGGFKKKEEI